MNSRIHPFTYNPVVVDTVTTQATRAARGLFWLAYLVGLLACGLVASLFLALVQVPGWAVAGGVFLALATFAGALWVTRPR